MTIDCQDCPLRRNPLFAEMSADEVRFMQRFKTGELQVEAGTPILMEGTVSQQLFTVLQGMGIRHTSLSDGRRQVINFIFPGDFIGLQDSLDAEMSHSIDASTDMTLCVFNRRDLWDLFKHHPSRAFAVTRVSAMGEHFLGQTLASVGQRSALESMAWALMTIFRRAEATGLTDGDSLRLPYRQQDMADALGLSLVHTNKTLAKLRDRQLATWAGGRLRINDMAGLARLADMTLGPLAKRPLI